MTTFNKKITKPELVVLAAQLARALNHEVLARQGQASQNEDRYRESSDALRAARKAGLVE